MDRTQYTNLAKAWEFTEEHARELEPSHWLMPVPPPTNPDNCKVQPHKPDSWACWSV